MERAERGARREGAVIGGLPAVWMRGNSGRHRCGCVRRSETCHTAVCSAPAGRRAARTRTARRPTSSNVVPTIRGAMRTVVVKSYNGGERPFPGIRPGARPGQVEALVPRGGVRGDSCRARVVGHGGRRRGGGRCRSRFFRDNGDKMRCRGRGIQGQGRRRKQKAQEAGSGCGNPSRRPAPDRKP